MREYRLKYLKLNYIAIEVYIVGCYICAAIFIVALKKPGF